MKISGKVHCFFEQSGTFKNEFIKLGIPAEDYDIQNNFGETDHVVDLFAEIERAYEGGGSIFDNISKDDLIIAFFPCIYFTGSVNPCYFTLEKNTNYKCMSMQEKFDQILKRADNRNDFYKLLYKMVANVLFRDLRLIIENPFSALHYLHNNFLKEPTVIDINRQKRGDYFRKPTGYWFFNCVNTIGESYQKPEKYLTVWEAKSASQQGLCSEERSMISPDYARNFICDFIIGKTQDNIEQQLLF
jgi:hypothetical protein